MLSQEMGISATAGEVRPRERRMRSAVSRQGGRLAWV